jgi:hypothetical protein
LRVPSDSHRAGELTFDPGYTGYVPTAGASVQQGMGWATFLLGETTHFARYVSSSTDAQERQKRFFWYAQDTWRVSAKLQLNYGVRWEMIFPEKVNAPGNGGQLDLRTGQIAVFGTGQVSDHGIQDMNWHNFAPRLGITYQLTPKTVVRAGYGWSYELGTFGTLFGHNVTQNLPVLANQNLNSANAFSGVFTLAQGPTAPSFPKADQTGHFPLPDGVNGKARPLTIILPRVMQYNATVQHQLTKNFSMSVGYVGNQGRHVFNGDSPSFNVNSPSWVPGISDQNLRKPFYGKYGWTQGIDFYCNCATNNYNSLQVQAEKRSSFGYTATGSYTFQHATNDEGNDYTFLYNRALGRGNTDFIAHHQFTLAQTYDIPFGKGRKYGAHLNPVINGFFGGWGLSAVTQWYSGVPFEPYIGNYPTGAVRPDVGPNNRPDIKAGGDPYAGAKHDRDQWFKGGLGDVFLVPANNQFGNMPRNWLFGPQFFNTDLALAKAFSIKERGRLQFRADSFNVFNHVNLNTPNNNITDATAGLITSLAPNAQMRRWQFGARLEF